MKTRPFRAALRFASVPQIVIDAALLVPETNVTPVVDPNVTFPCVTLSVTVSEVPTACASPTLIALPLPVENVSEVFS